MPTYTDKMGLRVPGDNDDLDALRDNWDRLDQGFSGVIWVPNDTIPDLSILYDGARVAEIASGKVWRAQKNVDGSYTRKWIKYPWIFTASFVQTNFPTGIVDSPWPYSTIESQCVNSGAADLVNGRLVIPVRGIYTGKISGLWSQGTGNRSQKLAVGAVILTNDSETIEKSWPAWPSPTNNYHFNRVFQAGDAICGSYWQTGAASGITLTGRIDITCVRPL
jgi:hypothetical protein